MIQAQSIFCEKYVTYHGPTQYDFVDGTTVLRGENRSGKSVLFSGLGNLLFGSPPIIQARNKAKQMHVRGGSTFAFNCHVNGRDLEIVQRLVGQSLKYSIKVDGKDKGTHTQAAYFEILDEFIPIPEDLFYSSVYIAGARPNPLHLGTGAQRMGYLQNMFDFEKFDDLRARLAELLDRSNQSVAEAEALKAEMRSLPGGRGINKRGFKKLDNALAYFKKQSRAASQSAKYLGEIESLNKVSGSQHPLKDLIDKLESLETRIAEVSDMVADADRAEEGRHEYKSALKQQTDLTSKADKLKSDDNFKIFSKSDPTKLRIEAEQLSSDVYRAKLDIDLMENNLRVNKEIEEYLEQVPTALLEFANSKDKIVTNISRLEAQVKRALEEVSEALDSHSGLSKGDKCPTCGQTVKTEFNAKEAKTRLKDLQECRKFLTRLDRIGVYSSSASKKNLGKLTLAHKKLLNKQKAIEFNAEKARQWSNIQSELKAVTKTVKNTEKYAEAKSNSKRLSTTLSSLKEQRRDLKDAIEARSRIDALNKLIEDDKATLAPDDLSTVIEVLLQTKSEAKALAKSHNRKDQIKRRLKELGKAIEYQDILKALVDAYGPRGLRVEHMSTIARMLEQSFNRFAPCVFPEPAYFSFGVAPSNVTVGVERNALPPSDAALLSGSEARCFQVLCYAALAPYIPARYRFDSVIMDELESMMTPATRKLYVESALPQISQSVRSLTIVTPLPEEEFFIDGARHIQVVKENSRSRLEITEAKK